MTETEIVMISLKSRTVTIATNHWKLEEARNDSFPESLEKTWPYSHLDFRFLVSGILGK